jgi:hypothetical protein
MDWLVAANYYRFRMSRKSQADLSKHPGETSAAGKEIPSAQRLTLSRNSASWVTEAEPDELAKWLKLADQVLGIAESNQSI